MNQFDFLPGHPAITFRPALVAGAILLTFAANTLHAQGTENGLVKQLAPVAPAQAGEWWKASWQEGWTYQHLADFTLSALTKITNKADVAWWQSLLTPRSLENETKTNEI